MSAGEKKEDAVAEMSFERALARLEAIAAEVKREDISLDDSLDLLEESVKLANLCARKADEGGWTEELEAADDRQQLPG